MLGHSPISAVAIAGPRTLYVPPPTPPPVVATNSGGYREHRGYIDYQGPRPTRTKEEIREARRRFGIIPKAVEKVIAAVAIEEIDAGKQARADELAERLEAKRMAVRDKYLQALEFEVARLKATLKSRDDEDDDEETLLLLL